MSLYSYSDNKSYPINLPEDDKEMLIQFENLIGSINTFDLTAFKQHNIEKCKKCIYITLCASGGEAEC